MYRFLIRALNKLNLLRFLNFKVRHRINGKSFLIPIHGSIGYDHLFEKEMWMTIILKKILEIKPTRAFIDVGVNLGQTLLKAKSINSAIRYIGFEPNMTCVAYIHELIDDNHLDQIQLFPAGISDKGGPATLYHAADKREDSSGSIIKEFRDVSALDEKMIVTLSSAGLSFLNEVTVGFVKIDVEGAELEVMKSLKFKVEADRPFIICEILPVYNEENIFRLERQNELLRIIEDLDYFIYRIHANGTLQQIDEIGIHKKIEDCNYLLVPTELNNIV